MKKESDNFFPQFCYFTVFSFTEGTFENYVFTSLLCLRDSNNALNKFNMDKTVKKILYSAIIK